MFKLIILFYILLINSVLADYKLTNLVNNLDSPWSITQVNENIFLINEKSGNIKFFDKSKKTLKKINHNLKILEHGQGGLMDIFFIKIKFTYLIQKKLVKKWSQLHQWRLQTLILKNWNLKIFFSLNPQSEVDITLAHELLLKMICYMCHLVREGEVK